MRSVFEIGGSDYGTVVALFPDGTVNVRANSNRMLVTFVSSCHAFSLQVILVTS